MRQNKIVDILIGVFVILLVAIVVVSAWVNRKSEEEQAKFNELQTVVETVPEKSTSPQTVVADYENYELTKQDTFYQAVKVLAEGTNNVSGEILTSIEEAAKEGRTDAQYFAGEMYLQGIGTQSDREKAAQYFEQAYENGNEHAFEIYGKICFLGDGLAQDYEKAYTAFSSILEPSASINCALGIMNIYGMGVRPDYEKAREYLNAAEIAGNAAAKVAKTSIEGSVYARRTSEAEPDIHIKEVKMVDYGDSELTALMDTVYALLESQESYYQFDEELMNIAKMSPAMAAKVAVFGRENWLFFQNNADGSSYHDYVGDNAFSEKELLAIQKNLEAQKQKAEAAGAKFVLLIYPNKEIIYHDKMPSYIIRESEVTRTDKLVAYLRENSGIEVIYPKEQLMEQKEMYQLYYATDTHCNMLGSFIGLSSLIEQVYGKKLTLDENNFDIHTREYAGDISVMIGRADRYALDTVYFLPEHKVANEDKLDSSMILIGDSFSDFLQMESSYYFKNGVKHYMIMNYGYNFQKAFQDALLSGTADIVVWECAERNIERLK